MAKGKKRTTMAKLNRETRLRERREEKEIRKAQRKLEAAAGPPVAELEHELEVVSGSPE